MEYKQKKEIYGRAKRIFTSNLDWVDKFDMIFGLKNIYNLNLDYYDPDTSYEEDVIAFMNAFDDHMKKEEIIAKQINNY